MRNVGYKLDELTKFATQGAELGSFIAVFSINEKVWQSLGEDVQKAMLQAGEEMSRRMGQVLDQEEEKLVEEFATKTGMKFHEVTPEEKPRWQEKVAPVADRWVKETNAKKVAVPAEQVLEEMRKVVSELQ